MKKIFIGWDKNQKEVFNVCKFSLEKRNSQKQIKVYPIKQDCLRSLGLYNREIDQLASTEFSLTRFLVPFLSDYVGFSIFMDCDFLIQDDITKLFEIIDPKKAVSVVKHDYHPNKQNKMNGKLQTLYPRKNWSSLIVFNNSHPSNKKLNLDIINNETPQYLHRFSWLEEEEIGEIPHTWNYLSGWYKDIEKPKGIHYTEGGPWFEEHKDCDFSKEWLYEYFLMKQNEF